MQYRLRTLLIALAIAPWIVSGAWLANNALNDIAVTFLVAWTGAIALWASLGQTASPDEN
jgi:hypothetical protein